MVYHGLSLLHYKVFMVNLVAKLMVYLFTFMVYHGYIHGLIMVYQPMFMSHCFKGGLMVYNGEKQHFQTDLYMYVRTDIHTYHTACMHR